MRIDIEEAQNPVLCEAFEEGAVSPVAWSVPIDVVYAEQRDSDGRGFQSMPRGAELDIDLDGKPEIVTVTYYNHGADQPLQSYTPYLTLVQASDPDSNALSQISGTFLGALNRRLEKTRDTEFGFPPALFEFEGKPYVLLGNRWVASFWNGERRDWCEYKVTGQYQILQFITQKLWPASAKWAVEQTTREPQR